MSTLRRQALQWLLCADPDAKAQGVRGIDRNRAPGAAEVIEEAPGVPGRPARPRLVAHTQLKPRSAQTPQGRAALLHALVHIELNAIDLALDAVWTEMARCVKPKRWLPGCCGASSRRELLITSSCASAPKDRKRELKPLVGFWYSGPTWAPKTRA